MTTLIWKDYIFREAPTKTAKQDNYVHSLITED